MIKLQKRFFIETLENNVTNSGHQHNAHINSSKCQKQFYDESILSRFEVLTKPIYKCNEDAHIMLHNTKTTLFNIKTFLNL